MRSLIAITTILLVSACSSFNPAQNGAIKSIGNNTYTISEMGVFGGNVAEHAAKYCAARGLRMSVEGNTTQRGLFSGDNQAVLIFRCT